MSLYDLRTLCLALDPEGFFSFLFSWYLSAPSSPSVPWDARAVRMRSVAKACSTLWDPMVCSLPGSSVHRISQARITWVGCHFLLQEIFLTQGSNPCLISLHWEVDSLPLSTREAHARVISSLQTVYQNSVSACLLLFSCSVMSDSLQPHGLQHTRLPVLHCLLELAQTPIHWVGDAIQPSRPLLSPSPPALNLSQHQGLSQWVGSSHQVAKVLELQLQHQSF